MGSLEIGRTDMARTGVKNLGSRARVSSLNSHLTLLGLFSHWNHSETTSESCCEDLVQQLPVRHLEEYWAWSDGSVKSS